MLYKQKKRHRSAVLQRCLVLFLVLLLGASFILAFAGRGKQEPVEWTTYTVCPGDKLYSIATELGIKNWREWCYEVCRVNDIKDGGTIYPGDEIIVYLD